MKRLNSVLTLFGLLVLTPHLPAAVLVGPNGVGPMTFGTNPVVSEFGTTVLNGDASTFADPATLDAAVNGIDIRTYIPIFKRLPETATYPPAGFSGGFRYNANPTSGQFIQSVPVTDGTNAANLLLARFQNNSGSAQSTFAFTYDFHLAGSASLGPNDELPGFRVYYSFTAEAGTWQPIPSLTATEVIGNHGAVLNLGQWLAGGLLFVIWVDDNADGQTDPSYVIDNFRAGLCSGPPPITSQPQSAIAARGQTVHLTVGVAGSAAVRWHRMGFGPIDPGLNPTAASATLTITNVQASDEGDYFAVVATSQPCALATTASSITARVQVAAPILVGPNGVGPMTFSTNPLVTEFSTTVVNGVGSTFTSVPQVNAMIAGFNFHTFVPAFTSLRTSGTLPPSAFEGGFRYNTSGRFIQSYISSGSTNAASLLVATLQNDSDKTLDAVVVSYDLVHTNFSGPSEPLPGLYVYYSINGLPGSWRPIPELTANVVSGNHVATLDLAEWHDGDLLYVVWFDDNVPGMDDPAYTIDNFRIDWVPPPPVILSQPRDVTNLVSRSVRLEVVADGVGLTYQWYKVGFGPISTAANPSAATSTLVITNAQLSDTGDYFVTVSNPAGGTLSSNAHIQINPDLFPPKLLAGGPSNVGSNVFNLVVDEPLCVDFFQCGANATCTFNWQIVPIVNGLEGFDLIVEDVWINGTNLFFRTSAPYQAGQQYRIKVVGDCDGGINDVFGNQLPAGAPGSTIDTLPTTVFTATKDAEIHSNATANTPLGQAMAVGIDLDDGGIARGLLQFENIVGSGLGQIPGGATIVSATLRLSQVDGGSAVNLHRMLIPWDEATATWNSLADGVTNDGVEAVVTSDASTPATAPNGFLTINVTASVQAWANGAPNFGWAFLSTGTDRWTWESSESSNPPTLVVVYSRGDGCQNEILTQPPAQITVTEGAPLSISLLVRGGAIEPAYQWFKDGVQIPGANSATYTQASAMAGCLGSGDNGVYRVRITCEGGTSVTSAPSVVTVTEDRTPIRLTAARSLDVSTVALEFSKALNVASAVETSHYVFDPPILIQNVAVSNRTVTLTTVPRPLVRTTLSISGVVDTRGCPNGVSPNPTVVEITAARVEMSWAATWFYNTNNLDATLGTVPWFASNYVPGPDWKTGEGLFGTESSAGIVALFPTPIRTVIPPNTNNPPGQITTYFRKQIGLAALPAGAEYALCHFVDDGAVFYLDGQEIGRVNMTNPPPVMYAHRSSSAGEALLGCFTFSAAPGQHMLAVEVHQGGETTSSDILFGAQIIALTDSSPSLNIAKAGTKAVVSWSADSSWVLQQANSLTGPYVTVSPTSGFGVHTNVAAGNATNLFFRLQFQP